MASLYRRRHPESTVLYRVLATHFDAFLARYETLFQRRYGYFRPVVREVVERYLDCANPMCGFARIRCPDCARDYLLTFSCIGNRLNFHPHLHMLVAEGGRTSEGGFHPVPIFNDAALTRLFAHEVLAFLVSRDLVTTEIADKILSWRHTGFGVHSKVRTTTTEEAQRVARYMAKPILALRRLSFNDTQGKVIYRYGKNDADHVEMDYLEFIARLTTHIPDKGQVMIRYYGLYSNAHRGVMRKRGQATRVPPVLTPPPPRRASPGWRELVRKVYEVDPLTCPACGAQMRVIAFITNYGVVDKIIHHLGVTFTHQRPPPPTGQEELY